MVTTKRLPTAERREQIARAALRIIARDGVHRLTMVELAREVGITDGSLFRHFKDKVEIVDAAIEVFETTLFEGFPPKASDPLERLRDFFFRRISIVRAHPEIVQLAFNDRLVEAAGERGAARVGAAIQRSVNFIKECILQAQEQGVITSAVPTAALVWVVMGMLRGAALGERLHGEAAGISPHGPAEVWEWIALLLCGGSGPRATSGEGRDTGEGRSGQRSREGRLVIDSPRAEPGAEERKGGRSRRRGAARGAKQ